jgi:methionyl-tRNA formyltransferase
MNRSERLVFFGTDEFSAAILKRLLASGWPVVGVVTQPDKPAGRGQKPAEPAVKQAVKAHGIKLFQPEKVAKIIFEIAALEPSHGVLAAYGQIVPQSLIDIFPGGIINVHPSLLPKYRGASPIEAAILAGDHTSGISLMALNAFMDEGPVYAQKEVILTGEETQSELYSRMAEIGGTFLVERLPAIADGSLPPEPQVDSKATYANLVKKQDGQINWDKSALFYERQIRAYATWPKSRAKINTKEVIVTKARVAKNESDGQLVMKCQPGYLEILELVGPSGKTMSGADFLRGYKK